MTSLVDERGMRRLIDLVGRRTSTPKTPSLRGDLVRAGTSFGAAAVLLAAWHPWTAFSAEGSASSCGVAIVEASNTLHAAAVGPDALQWCTGEVGRAPQGTAATEAPSVATAVCDFYVGRVQVRVAGTSASDANAFCAATGVLTSVSR